MLHLSIDTLLRLAFTDEEHYHDRVWLSLYTEACGHCRVIDKVLAEELYALDPDESIIHIQLYEPSKYGNNKLTDRIPESFKVAKVSAIIHTLWPILAWRESNERVRIARDASNSRRLIRSTRDICEFIARDVALRMTNNSKGETTKLITTGLINEARTYGWDVKRMLDYIDFAVKECYDAAGKPLNLTAQHRKDFVAIRDEVINPAPEPIPQEPPQAPSVQESRIFHEASGTYIVTT